MADAPVVHIGENSPEEVALKLFRLIRDLQGDQKPKDKKAILDLYAECLNAVQNPSYRVRLA
jgi:hypothetical protein